VGHRDFLQDDKPVALLLYNIWVFMNYKREKVTVQHVKFLLMVEAIISNIYVTIFR